MTRQFAALTALAFAFAAAGACASNEQSTEQPAAVRDTAGTERPVASGGAEQQRPATRDAGPVQSDSQVLADFKDRLDQYISVRKKADDTAPALKRTEDSAKIREAQQTLAERIRAARATARQGDIFTPEISAYLRRLLRPETKEPGTKAAIKDDNPVSIPFKVNGAYPEKEPLSTVPPNVLQTLPKLPDDVEYRFVGKHMILRDVRANLIIDYMANAIP